MRFGPIAALSSTLALTCAAQASFHFMQIEQIIGGVGGNTNAQAIQLRMRFAGQNQVQFSRVVSRDAAGLNPIILCDMGTFVSQSAAGTRVLITTAAFNALCTPAAVSNFTMIPIPANRLAAGRITFEQDDGLILWSVAYGGSSYTGVNTGSITNDSDGNFGTPFAGPLPSTSATALRFTGNTDALSTTNVLQYALTPAAAVFTNSAGRAFTVTPPPPPPCPTDFNNDGVSSPDDLDEFITTYFNDPPSNSPADFNDDGLVTPDDLDEFITAFFEGC